MNFLINYKFGQMNLGFTHIYYNTQKLKYSIPILSKLSETYTKENKKLRKSLPNDHNDRLKWF